MSVPEFGRKVLGIGKNSAYAAAARGEIPTLKVGGLKRVPVRRAMKLLELGEVETAA